MQTPKTLSSEQILAIQNQLLQGVLSSRAPTDILQEFYQELSTGGLHIYRAVIGCLTLHPVFGSFEFQWTLESQQVKCVTFPRQAIASENFQNTPFYYLATHQNLINSLHINLQKGIDRPWFPLFDRLRSEGMTDYLAFFTSYVIQFYIPDLTVPPGIAVSFTTDSSTGFTIEQCDTIKKLFPSVCMVVKYHSFSIGLTDVLATYVGQRTSKRILSGEIDRGSLQSIRSIIWFGDLRGFTRLSDTTPPQIVVECLNIYLECVSRPVIKRGGEVLKYMGDGVLAFFELEEQISETINLALEAANETFKNLQTLNQQRQIAGEIILEFDLVLHIGSVLYGNVGAIERLDFTVIGPAVNEASRMESLCDKLNCHLLLSDAFVSQLNQGSYSIKSLGFHQLRGVNQPKEIFTLCLD